MKSIVEKWKYDCVCYMTNYDPISKMCEMNYQPLDKNLSTGPSVKTIFKDTCLIILFSRCSCCIQKTHL